MARGAFLLHVRPERVADYVAEHARVWPEMREAISAAGIRNYSIHLYGTQAFGHFEADDVGAALARLAETDVNARWQDAMAVYLDDRVADDGPALLPEVFRLD